YQALIRAVMVIPPRYWEGWDVQDDLLVWYLFRDLLPAPVQGHLKAYWTAWLQPDLPTTAFVHPQSSAAIDSWQRKRCWRSGTPRSYSPTTPRHAAPNTTPTPPPWALCWAAP